MEDIAAAAEEEAAPEHSYVVTVACGTAVTHCVAVELDDEDEHDDDEMEDDCKKRRKILVVGRGGNLELYQVDDYNDEPRLLSSRPLFGRLAALRVMRHGGKQTLLLVTECRQFAILGGRDLKTLAAGDMSDYFLSGQSEALVVVVVESRLIGCLAYQGLFKAVALDDRGLPTGGVWTARLNELGVVDAALMRSRGSLLLLLLLHKTGETTQLTAYRVANRELHAGPWTLSDMDAGSTRIAVTPRGLFVFGGRELAFYNNEADNAFERLAIKAGTRIVDTTATADGVLALDANGSLYCASRRVGKSTWTLAGSCDPAVAEGRCLAVVCAKKQRVLTFVGSSLGDSCLVDLSDDACCSRTVLPPNLGPVLDLCIAKNENGGQGRLLACCGFGERGSLRVISEGIGLRKQRSHAPSDGGQALRRVWATDSLVFLGYTRGTECCSLETFQPVDCPLANERTYEFVFSETHAVQITPSGARRFTLGLEEAGSWQPEGRCTLARAAGPCGALVATTERRLVILDADLTVAWSRDEEEEPAALALSARATAVAFWESRRVEVTDRGETTRSTVVCASPRQLAFVDVDSFLVAGLADGRVCVFKIEADLSLAARQTLSVGARPPALFDLGDGSVLAAGGDRACVLSLRNNDDLCVVITGVQFTEDDDDFSSWEKCVAVCPLANGRILAASAKGGLGILAIDGERRLRSRVVPLGEQPRCVCHDASRGLICCSTTTAERGSVRFFGDSEPFDEVTSTTLLVMEQPQCCSSLDLGVSVVAVGTAIASPSDFEPTAGRVLLFGGKRVELTCSVEVEGAVYDLAALPKGELVAAVNQSVCVYALRPETAEKSARLELVARFDDMIVALKIGVSGDTIAVGDLMRSLTLLKFDRSSKKHKLAEVARDYNAHWTTALLFAGSSVLLADASRNLLALRLKPSPQDDEEARCLETVAEMHLGESLNAFATGSLVVQQQLLTRAPLLFGCVSGMVGCVLAITPSRRDRLAKLSLAMAPSSSLAGLDYTSWRGFKNARRKAESLQGFVDGDLVESFLDLDGEAQREVLERLDGGATLEAVVRDLEDLRRLH